MANGPRPGQSTGFLPLAASGPPNVLKPGLHERWLLDDTERWLLDDTERWLLDDTERWLLDDTERCCSTTPSGVARRHD
jgi:transposase InsO family protein